MAFAVVGAVAIAAALDEIPVNGGEEAVGMWSFVTCFAILTALAGWLALRDRRAIEGIKARLRAASPCRPAAIERYRPLDTTPLGQRVALTLRVGARVREVTAVVPPLQTRMIEPGVALAVRAAISVDGGLEIDWDRSFEWWQDGVPRGGYRRA